MKKTRTLIIFMMLSILTLVGCSENDKNEMTGIFLKSMNGNHLIIDENGSPIEMGNETGKENIFDDLQSGDKIEITYDAIMERYPGQTHSYSCKLLEKGHIDDISTDTLNTLQEYGWIFDLSD